MGLMPPRGFSVVLPAIVALGVGGAWAGSALSALPLPPTVSLPTVTVPLPPPPVPVPAPPAVTVPPKVEVPPPPPPASPPPIDAPVELSPAPAPALPSVAPGLRGGGVSPVYPVSGRPTRSKPSTRPTLAPKADRAAVVPAARAGSPADGAEGVVATAPTLVQGPVPEGAGFFGPIGSAFNALDVPTEVIPPALLAMAALAILLFALASAPLPARTSRAGATLVHLRGSIAVAGTAALMMALGTYLLL
jgi:hypothetical protein